MEVKAATATTAGKTTAWKTAFEVESELLTSAPKRVKATTTAAAHSHIFEVLASVISRPFLFVPKNLHRIINVTIRYVRPWL